MLEISGLNWLAVIIAWVVNCAVGAYWYSPAGFAKQWTKFTDINIMEIPANEATKILGFVVASGLVQAITLAVVLNALQPANIIEGAVAGLVLWFGLVAATTVGVTLYSRRSWGFWWLNASYFLVVMIINSIILVWW